MQVETPFRVALVVVIFITMAIGIPHRLKAVGANVTYDQNTEGGTNADPAVRR
jgi:hypothetical protein